MISATWEPTWPLGTSLTQVVASSYDDYQSSFNTATGEAKEALIARPIRQHVAMIHFTSCSINLTPCPDLKNTLCCSEVCLSSRMAASVLPFIQGADQLQCCLLQLQHCHAVDKG